MHRLVKAAIAPVTPERLQPRKLSIDFSQQQIRQSMKAIAPASLW